MTAASPSIWERNEFPTLNIDVNAPAGYWPGRGRSLSGTSNHWKATKRRPFCWTPTKAFCFGGRQFIPLYPCIAFETTNFGHVIQRRWDGLTMGRE